VWSIALLQAARYVPVTFRTRHTGILLFKIASLSRGEKFTFFFQEVILTNITGLEYQAKREHLESSSTLNLVPIFHSLQGM
jgi:hypothetical protein